MQGDVRLFEIGSVFEPTGKALPREIVRAGVLVMGRRHPAHFTSNKGEPFDEWDAKGIAERVARDAHPGVGIALVPAEGEWLWRVHAGGADVGGVRRVALDAPVWAAPALGVEIALAEMQNAAVAPRGQNAHGSTPRPEGRTVTPYRPLPVTPAADFDIALIVPTGRTVAAVEAVIRRTAGELLERLELFDEYTGKGIEPGTRSLAWRLTFRHPERTLRDKEIEGPRVPSR